MGQAVLEQRHLVSDSLAVSRFDHACLHPKSQAFSNKLKYGVLKLTGEKLKVV
jgi:hypothetical protein